jgi:hypothetical protein
MTETLLPFDEIVEKLDTLFLDIPPELREDLSDMTLKASGLSPDTIAHIQNATKTNLPALQE